MSFVDKLLGNTSESRLKKLAPIVKTINELEPKLRSLSDGELRARTDDFKKGLQAAKRLTIYCPRLTPPCARLRCAQ